MNTPFIRCQRCYMQINLTKESVPLALRLFYAVHQQGSLFSATFFSCRNFKTSTLCKMFDDFNYLKGEQIEGEIKLKNLTQVQRKVIFHLETRLTPLLPLCIFIYLPRILRFCYTDSNPLKYKKKNSWDYFESDAKKKTTN